MVSKGNHPQMALQFRLVKYYNLHIYIYIYLHSLDGKMAVSGKSLVVSNMFYRSIIIIWDVILPIDVHMFQDG